MSGAPSGPGTIRSSEVTLGLGGTSMAASIPLTVARRCTMSGMVLKPPGIASCSWSRGSRTSGSIRSRLDMNPPAVRTDAECILRSDRAHINACPAGARRSAPSSAASARLESLVRGWRQAGRPRSQQAKRHGAITARIAHESGCADAWRSGGAAVEQFLGEPVQLHTRALAVGQHRVDPRPRAADRGDPVQGVLAAEDRERARAAGQPDHSPQVAQQDLPDAGVVLVTLVA